MYVNRKDSEGGGNGREGREERGGKRGEGGEGREERGGRRGEGGEGKEEGKEIKPSIPWCVITHAHRASVRLVIMTEDKEHAVHDQPGCGPVHQLQGLQRSTEQLKVVAEDLENGGREGER